MFFMSDNAGPAHPKVMEALNLANTGYALPYGNDALTAQAVDQVRAVFEAPKADVYMVGTGTAANALILAVLAQPWDGIFAHKFAHINEDECGAPEFYTGGSKLILIEGESGKLTPEKLRAKIERTGAGGVHNVQRGPLSLTQISEAGTIYSIEEICALTRIAKEYGLKTHMDGARFANACAALGAAPAEITWKAGIDALSFGGTKNGLIGVEVVIFFSDELAWEFELRRKRAGQLYSKNRFFAAQINAYLTDDLWLKLGAQANEKAKILANGLADFSDVSLNHAPGGNMVFATLPLRMHRAAKTAGAQYYLLPMDSVLEGPDDQRIAARFVCDWSLPEEEIARFLAILKAA